MSNDIHIRWGWLKLMYWYTILGAGVSGLAMLVAPEMVRALFGWPSQDPVMYGIAGSVWLAFGILSVLGLKSPLKFLPVLLMQLTYKSAWFIGVIFPLLIAGKFPAYAILLVAIMASYIIGDLIAIPFPYVFSKREASRSLQTPETA